MSIREEINVNLIESAKGMQRGHGYNLDWQSFFRHLAPDEPDDVPAYGQQDISESLEQSVYDLLQKTLTVEHRGYTYVADPEQAGTVANMMIADIERMLMNDPTRRGLAVDTRMVRNDTFIGFPATGGVTVAIVSEIDYRTAMADPNTAV